VVKSKVLNPSNHLRASMTYDNSAFNKKSNVTIR